MQLAHQVAQSTTIAGPECAALAPSTRSGKRGAGAARDAPDADATNPATATAEHDLLN